MSVMGLLCACYACAQTSVVSAGGEGAELSFSVGQAIAGTAIGNGSAEIGVQQTYVMKVSGLSEAELMAEVTVYPNPTSSFLHITMPDATDVVCMLYGENGQLITTSALSCGSEQIDMRTLPAGNYILRLSGRGKEQIFQVIKTNK